MKSSHQVHLEMIEHSLQPAACFQLQAAKHKVLVIRDAFADDKEYCEALLLKIDHLLSQETVPAVSRSTVPQSHRRRAQNVSGAQPSLRLK